MEYDKLVRENLKLESKFPKLKLKSSPNNKVGSIIQNKFNKSIHLSPMHSLANGFNMNDLKEFDERIKKLLKNEKFVSFNLVSIATEAGFQECIKTVNFLKANNFPLDNIVINHLVPDFEDSVWEASATNKAVSLIKMEYDLQKPYRLKYEHLCEVEGLKLVGLYKVPFQPI